MKKICVLGIAGFVFLWAGLGLAQDTVKFGGFLPMTGAVAAYGQDASNGIKIAMEMKPTVLGKKVGFCRSPTPRATRSRPQTP